MLDTIIRFCLNNKLVVLLLVVYKSEVGVCHGPRRPSAEVSLRSSKVGFCS